MHFGKSVLPPFVLTELFYYYKPQLHRNTFNIVETQTSILHYAYIICANPIGAIGNSESN